MKLRHKIYLVILVLLSVVVIYALVKGPPKIKIPSESFTLIYTNNQQGKLLEPTEDETIDGVFPSDFTTLYLTLAELKNEAGSRSEPVFFVDGGNTLSGDEDISRQMGGIPMDRLLYEVPYNAMLFRENEYMLGESTLKDLWKKFAYLGLNIRNYKGKQAFVTNSVKVVDAGDLKIALIGYFEPQASSGQISRRFSDFQFERNWDFVKAVVGSVEADAKVLIVSVPNIDKFALEIQGVDLIIPTRFHPSIDFNKITILGKNRIAPPVNSGFDVGKVRFVRAKPGKDRKTAWDISATVKSIKLSEEIPPGGILNVVLDARQNMDIKYKGKYGSIYSALTFWSPEKYEKKKLGLELCNYLLTYFGTSASVIDGSKLKLPEDQSWSIRDILDLPGKTLNLSVFKIKMSILEKIKNKNPKIITYYRGGGKVATSSLMNNDFFVVIDRDLIKDFSLSELRDLQEVPFPGNYVILDFVRKNRGQLYVKLSDGDTPYRDALEAIDDQKFEKSAELFTKAIGKDKTVDGLMYLGFCFFKMGKYIEAIKTWKEASSIAPKNKGIIQILTATKKTESRKKKQKKSKSDTWYKFRGNSQNTGRTDVEGPSSNLLKWKYEALDKMMSSPVVGPYGTIYIGAEDFYLYALNPSGKLKWKFRAGLPVRSSPLVSKTGVVYFGSDDKHLYALNSKGKEIWKFKGEGYFVSSPALGKDGTIYTGCDDFNIYAITPDGKLKWKYATGGVVFSSPAIGKNGTIYMGSEDHFIYALNPDGKLKWKFETKHKVNASPAVGKDGTIYVGSEDRSFYAITPGGKLKWKTELGNYIVSSPAIAKDGTIYTGCEDKHLYALSSDGKIKWKFKTRGEIISSPLVDGKSRIYVGSDDGNLYCLSPEGRQKWVFMARDPIMSSPALAPDGTLYVGSEDRNVYAIGE